MIRTAAAIARRLAVVGYRVKDNCSVGYARQDLLLCAAEERLGLVRRQLKTLLRAHEARRAFAGLCYSSVDMQRQFLELAEES